ncbi:MAG: hypothetical protein KGH56_03595 [Patescibacteria group bacterium]|nr:hypothetical protein [Patescibacteria group bacterium]
MGIGAEDSVRDDEEGKKEGVVKPAARKKSFVWAVLDFVLFPLFLFMKWLAKESVLFTTVREGTVKAIMRGKSLERFIMSFAGYHLNDPSKTDWYRTSYTEKGAEKILQKWEVIYHGTRNKYGFAGVQQLDDYYDDRPALLKHLGLYWVGWPWANSVYVYPFEWNETSTVKETGEEKVLPRAEPTDFIYVADFTYAITTSGAETKDRMPTDELTLVTVAIRNPYRALFSGEDWMRRITAAINRHVRNFVSSKGYDELISLAEKKGVGKESNVSVAETSRIWSSEFSLPIIALSNLLPDETENSPPPRGLHDRYGVEIRTADLQSVELSGSEKAKEEHLAAVTRKYTATQTAAAITIEGEAKAAVVEMMGAKEAEALSARLKIIKEFGDAGITLAGLDAIQESAKGPGNTIIWANNPLKKLGRALFETAKGGEKS